MFNPGIKPLPLKQPGTYLLRFLPQPAGAPWYRTIPFLWNQKTGYLILTESQAGALGRVEPELRADPRFAGLLWSRDNPDGVNIRPRWRYLFMGFDIEDPNPSVRVIHLARAGADIVDLGKTDDLVDPRRGRSIILNVSGEGPYLKMTAKLGSELPLTGTLRHLPAQVTNLATVGRYASDEKFDEFLRSVLPEEARLAARGVLAEPAPIDLDF